MLENSNDNTTIGRIRVLSVKKAPKLIEYNLVLVSPITLIKSACYTVWIRSAHVRTRSIA